MSINNNNDDWEQAVFDRVALSLIHNSSPVYDEDAYRRQMLENAADAETHADALFDMIDQHAKPTA